MTLEEYRKDKKELSYYVFGKKMLGLMMDKIRVQIC
jgi:hypothetical protein